MLNKQRNASADNETYQTAKNNHNPHACITRIIISPSKTKTLLNDNLLASDSDDEIFLSCKEDNACDKSFDLKKQYNNHSLANTPHLVKENLKKNLIQQIISWFKALIHYLRINWCINKSYAFDFSGSNKGTLSQNVETQAKPLNPSETISATTTTPLTLTQRSHPNTFFQLSSKKEAFHSIEASCLGIGLNR